LYNDELVMVLQELPPNGRVGVDPLLLSAGMLLLVMMHFFHDVLNIVFAFMQASRSLGT
jgi:hypothetical protein